MSDERVVDKLARFNDKGELSCAVCKIAVKSSSLWLAHTQGALHISKLRVLQALLQKKRDESGVIKNVEELAAPVVTAQTQQSISVQHPTLSSVNATTPSESVRGTMSALAGYSDSDDDNDNNKDTSIFAAENMKSCAVNEDEINEDDIEVPDSWTGDPDDYIEEEIARRKSALSQAKSKKSGESKENEETDGIDDSYDANEIIEIVDDDGTLWRLVGDEIVCVSSTPVVSTLSSNLTVFTGASKDTDSRSLLSFSQSQLNQPQSKENRVKIIAHWKEEDEALDIHLQKVLHQQSHRQQPRRVVADDSIEALEADEFLRNLTSSVAMPSTSTSTSIATLNLTSLAHEQNEDDSNSAESSRPVLREDESMEDIKSSKEKDPNATPAVTISNKSDPLQRLLTRVHIKQKQSQEKTESLLHEKNVVTASEKRRRKIDEEQVLQAEGKVKRLKIDANLSENDEKNADKVVDEDESESEDDGDNDDDDDGDDLEIDNLYGWRSR